MHRNLDRRVEALVRVTAPEQVDGLIKYVDLQMADSTMSWHMQPDGTYVLHTKDDEGRPAGRQSGISDSQAPAPPQMRTTDFIRCSLSARAD